MCCVFVMVHALGMRPTHLNDIHIVVYILAMIQTLNET